jgi:hypothetical protein
LKLLLLPRIMLLITTVLLGVGLLGRTEAVLDPLAVAEAGTVIAEETAGLVVDLLCGCGCRTFDIKTCVADEKKICKDVTYTKCSHKENVECKDEFKEECKTIYNDVCDKIKKKVCKTEYREECKPVYKPPTYNTPAQKGKECKKVPEEKCQYVDEKKCHKVL